MKDPRKVLQQKEADLARVRMQVESLNIAASLLAEEDDESDTADDAEEDERLNKKASTSAREAEAHETEWDAESSPFLKALKRAG